MTQTLLERVWAWIHQTFPERQIYIRSDGRVQFFTFGPSLQATLAGLSLIFLGWVAFATVNVIFKDRIITAKDNRFQQMQTAYENRLADLQISYDELNGALVGAEDKFKATADELQAKQNTIAGFLGRKNQIEVALKPGGNAISLTAQPTTPTDNGDGAASDSLDVAAPPDSDAQSGDSSLTMMPGPVAPQPRIAKPIKSGFLDKAWHRVVAFAATIFTHPDAHPAQIAAAYAQHPALRALAEQTERVRNIGAKETLLMVQTGGALQADVGNLQSLVARTGINPGQFMRKVQASEGIGGPELPLDQMHVEGITDSAFTGAYLQAQAVLNELNDLSGEMSHIPLTTPVAGAQFDRSSGFGARIDPFTGRYAFHPGIDFAGPWGAAVTATAPGTVVFAGNRGSYGNMVEVDHGFGIHTRYGHLSAITVRVGEKIAKGGVVGRLGSTGRSTGPHVHYEVWYDDVVRNPSNFIEAGRHVL